MTKFSIIVSVEDNTDNIEKCLNSIYTQTFKDFEVILINYTNDNNVLRITKRYDDKIKIISNENNSFSELKNKAIDEALSEYILFINANDYIELNTLSILDKCTKNNMDVVRFQFRKIDQKSKEKVISELSFKTCNGQEALNNIVKYKYINFLFTYVFNLKYIKDNNYKFEDRFNHDFKFIFDVIYNANKVISIGDILYDHYEIYESNKKEYEIIKNEAYDTLYFGGILLDQIKNKYIRNYISKEIILKATKLKKDDYKNILIDIKEKNIINNLEEDSLNIKKILYNIDIKLASRLIKW